MYSSLKFIGINLKVMTQDSDLDERRRQIELVNEKFELGLFPNEIKELSSGNTISLEVERVSKIHSAFMTKESSGNGLVEILDSVLGSEAMEAGVLSFAPQTDSSVKFCYQFPALQCCLNVNLINLQIKYP